MKWLVFVFLIIGLVGCNDQSLVSTHEKMISTELSQKVPSKLIEDTKANIQLAVSLSEVNRFLKQGASEVLLEVQSHSFSVEQAAYFNIFPRTELGQFLGLFALSYAVNISDEKRALLYLGVFETFVAKGKPALFELAAILKLVEKWNKSKSRIEPSTEPLSFLYRHLTAAGGHRS